MKPFKALALVIIIVPYVFFGASFALNVYLDPDQILAGSKAAPFVSRGEKRYQNAGIINNYDVRNILVGGSLMNNVVPSEVERAMGWDKVFSLSFAGGDLLSNSKMAQYAMMRRRIDHVMFVLQPVSMAETPPGQIFDPRSPNNYLYLYDDSRLNDFLVFAQLPTYFIKEAVARKSQRDLVKKVFGLKEDAKIFEASRDLYSHYMRLYRVFNRPLFISSLAPSEQKLVPLTALRKRNVEENFRQYVEPLVAGNPGTQFFFIIPPETYLANKSRRDIVAFAIEYFVTELARYPNARIYGFTNDAFNADLRLYTDLNHSHIEVARYMIQELAHDGHRLTKKNVGAYTRELRGILGGYEVPALWKTAALEKGENPYSKAEGYITYYDAARLVWGNKFVDALYTSIPRSRYLSEDSYVDVNIKTSPPLNATRRQLEAAGVLKTIHRNAPLYDVR